MYHAQLAGTQANGLNGLSTPVLAQSRAPPPTQSPPPPMKCDDGRIHGSQSGSASPSGAIANMERDKDRATYLQQLIKDQKCCLSYPNVFHHVERLLSEGKNRT